MKFNLKIFLFFIALVICAANKDSRAENPAVIINRIKTSSADKDIALNIAKLGLDDSLLNYYNNYDQFNNDSGTVFRKIFLKRAEVFKVNIDQDPQNEYVAQAIFQTGTEKFSRKIYFIFLLDDSLHNFTPLWHRVYDAMICDRTTDTILTFTFKPSKVTKSNVVIFSLNETTSCGTVLSAFERKDTLSYMNSEFKFIKGKPINEMNHDYLKDSK